MTNCINNEFLNDVNIIKTNVGDATKLTVSNTDNTNAASNSNFLVKTGGASGGDAYVNFSTTATDFSWGLDNSDSDALSLATGTSIGATVYKRIQNGNIRRPYQPCFMASTAIGTAITGAGAVYGPVTFSVENFDIGSNYNSGTGTYTCPTTGIYLFNGSINLTTTILLNSMKIDIVTTSYTYSQTYKRPSIGKAMGVKINVIVPMTAGDTAYLAITGSGEATNRCDMNNSFYANFFSGVLIQ